MSDGSDRVPAVFRATSDAEPAAIRSFTGVFHRRACLARGCAAVRLYSGCVPDALLRVSPRSTVRLLRREADRTAAATQEGQAPRYCRRAAQAQLLDLRHKPCAQRTGNAAWHD